MAGEDVPELDRDQLLALAKQLTPELQDHKVGSDAIIAVNTQPRQYTHIPFSSLQASWQKMAAKQAAGNVVPASVTSPGGNIPARSGPNVASRDLGADQRAEAARRLGVVAEENRRKSMTPGSPGPGRTLGDVKTPGPGAPIPPPTVRTTVAPLKPKGT